MENTSIKGTKRKEEYGSTGGYVRVYLAIVNVERRDYSKVFRLKLWLIR